MPVSPRYSDMRLTLIVATTCVLALVRAAQLDIVIGESTDGVFISLKGALDLNSGTTFLGDSPSVSNIAPFIKIGHSDDGAADLSLIDMQTSDTSYYMVDATDSSWSFECIKSSTEIFTNIADDNLGNSIGFLVSKQETGLAPAILVSKDGDYGEFFELTSVSVSSVEELGLVRDSTCFMEFGSNRIELRVGEDASGPTPTDSPLLRPKETESESAAPTPAPSQAPCDWLCQAGKFFGL